MRKGAPGGNRTLNLSVRSASLCPFELLGLQSGIIANPDQIAKMNKRISESLIKSLKINLF